MFGTTNNAWDPARGPGALRAGRRPWLRARPAWSWATTPGDPSASPAHFSHVCGLKPSYGSVPGRGHIPEPPGWPAPTTGRVGCQMKFSPQRKGTPKSPPRSSRLQVTDLLRDNRMAAWPGRAGTALGREVCAVLESACEALRGAGARIDDTARPAIAFAQALRSLNGWRWRGRAFASDEVCQISAQPVQEEEPALTLAALSGAFLIFSYNSTPSSPSPCVVGFSNHATWGCLGCWGWGQIRIKPTGSRRPLRGNRPDRRWRPLGHGDGHHRPRVLRLDPLGLPAVSAAERGDQPEVARVPGGEAAGGSGGGTISPTRTMSPSRAGVTANGISERTQIGSNRTSSFESSWCGSW